MSVNSNFGINFGQEFQSLITDDNGTNHSYGDGLWATYYPTNRIQGDLNYLYKLGFRNLRVASGDLSLDLTQFHTDRFAAELHTCDLALIKGFHVEFGAVPANVLKPSDWKYWIDNVLTYAQQFQALVTLRGGDAVWILGNENEANGNLAAAGSRDIITSMTRTSNVVTVVMPLTHSLTTGDVIRYYNAASGNGSGSTLEVASNAPKTITVVDANTFTFASTGSDGTTSTGWIQYDASTVRNQMKRRATALKAAGITVPLSYSCVQGNDVNAQLNIKSFGIAGRGDLDFVDLNIYGVPSNQDQRFDEFITEVAEGISRFGVDHFRVTEWHTGTSNSLLPTDSEVLKSWMRRRRDYLQSISGLKHYLFCYRHASSLLTATDPYNSSTTQTFKDYWYTLTGQRSTTKQATSSTTAGVKVSKLRTDNLVHTRISTLLEFNYGQDIQDGTYETTTVNSDLDAMWAIGCRKIRVAMSNYSFTAGVDASKLLVAAAKAKGFYVVWGVSVPQSTLTDANWSDYTSAVNTAADWATSNSVDEFCIGNEIEYAETVYAGLTSSVAKIKTMATDVKSNHFSGTISYAMGQSSMDYTGAPGGWISSGKGDIDKLGYNVYADDGLTIAEGKVQLETRTTDLYNAFGSALYISEWNIGTGTLFPSDTPTQSDILVDRLNFFYSLGITTTYLFTYRWDNGSTNEKRYFPLIQGSAYKEWFGRLTVPTKITP